MSLNAARIHEVEDDLLAAIDYCYEQGWTDGLPVVPPDVARVEAMLLFEGRPAETVIATHPATGFECTVHAAAVNAVMAGCKPEFFPVVVAAFEAMNEPGFNFHGSTASTGGSAPLLVVSGPVIDDIGMNADVNLFGPGNRANATIGRAVRLILMNVFRMIPGISDKSTQGNPGKFSFCIAERARDNPWPLLVEDQDYPPGVSSVTVFAGGGFCNVENHGGNTPEEVLGSIADAMANYGCITLGQSVVVLSPEHMRVIAGADWTRKQVQEFLFSHAARTVEGMKFVGKYRQREYDTQHAADKASALVEEGKMHRGLNPDDILVLMGGGDAGGHSCFIPSWSRGRGSIMQSKPIGVCIDCD
ncbi:MAG: hypothetical protein HOK30_19020 [Rhodospirillaceae bacterium]|jgi:hypothetical protein|nr:hypothetical protein [Rhodospirillaceae bacterium]MBT5191759.1 hypothetical protein [Rhodospirillaceae bacterium]MBT6429769.1 hypothetical protein [Rhodospirillaceae bacterium]MBT7758014.1 hypothetical protein [Rhodospirillaceae bacterium]